ncbi:sodium channel protein Nach-like [Phymastichus coffea]|uniref:sodium channel protein Nach-like n=1 Tax=Phymastichus coffea TaxID=108790 RepID=UPI00273C0A7F|nr:sodium channel protein Nach-like [Phymastichus coffea]
MAVDLCWKSKQPGLKLLRYSLSKRRREFVRENSLHVVPYFVDPTRSIYQRVMWFLIFIASAIAAVATIVIIWQKFQTSPTLTYLNIERENVSVDFPNVYLCFDKNHLDFSKSQLRATQITGIELLYERSELFQLMSNEDLDGLSFSQILYESTPECQDLLFNCEFRKQSYDCETLFPRKIATADGICCEFKSRRIDKDDPAWSLQFQISEYPINVHLTGKSEGPPLLGQEPTHRLLAPASIGLSLTITSTANSVRFLTRSQRKCVYPEESLSHADCERTLHKNVMLAKCSCLPWFYADSQMDECYFWQYQCLSTIPEQKLTSGKCYMSCEHTAYNVEKIERNIDAHNSNNASTEIKFLSWPEVRFRRKTRFGWLDLVVSFGGVAGFFIGYSIITSFEILYYFSLRTYCGAVLSMPKTKFNVPVEPAHPCNNAC